MYQYQLIKVRKKLFVIILIILQINFDIIRIFVNKMQQQLSNSLNPEDYEILIRKRGDNTYASYCPQLNLILKGNEHQQVRDLMQERINQHIKKIKSSFETLTDKQ